MSRKQKRCCCSTVGSASHWQCGGHGSDSRQQLCQKRTEAFDLQGFPFFLFSTCNSFQLCYNDNSLDGDIAQLGERCVRNAKVAGSNPVVSMIEKVLKTLVFPLFSRLFCVFKISSGTKYSVIGTHVSVQGSHGLSVSMNLPHIFSKRTFEKIQKNKKNSSILNYPML